MESLRKLLARISKELKDLTRSQRTAIVLGGLLVAVSAVWLLQWAARPEMVPLLDQELSPEDIARVRSGLELVREPFRLVGNKILVRADTNRQALLAQLQQQNQLPADTSVGFAALVKESNPWISQAEHERRWNVALKYELERVLRQFNGVRSASVFLPLVSSHRQLGRAEPPASASVTLVMQGGQPVPRELALAAARLVAGAVRGLSVRNVEVLDGNGVSALDWETESAGISSLERQRRQQEQEIRAKILSQLPDPKSRVAVRVELELTARSSENEVPGEPVPTREESTSEETARLRSSAEPGVTPNVGLAAGGRSSDERTTRETVSTEYTTGIKRTQESTPAGAVREIWAAVSISRSYLEAIYRQAYPDAASVSEAQIQQVFERERPRIVAQLTKLVKPQHEDHLAVDWYYDTSVEELGPARSSALEDAFQLARRYGPQAGLGLLAIIALAAMLRMARKTDGGEAFGLEIGLPKEAIEAAQQAAKDLASAVSQGAARRRAPQREETSSDILEGGPVAVGQAAMTEGILVAQEVDEKTVQTNKMLEQVAQVVEADAEGVAALLEQWIQRTDAYER
jgi:flagellar biosynthesis/type III secretory pathway M-ring protein FliF/YscJ